MIHDHQTIPMPRWPAPAPQRTPVYPRPYYRRTAFLMRLACLTLLVAILSATVAAFFATPHDWPDPFATPPRTYPACAQETLVWTGKAYLVSVNEVCQ